ncbi:unnamed protein product [Cylicocyclus nassatus]|uniref:ShKT domain-containing protein n=1 Tax=Cylicocyclus nassatus TaxID=53992 RepID=A0AA36GD50_CYLNA|nr:unnamed protein product [Cylicocyclus nassatus]
MISRPLLLQIILFGVALTTTKAGGDLREQSNLDLFGSSSEDDAKELENIFKSDDSAEQRKSEAPQTEEVTNTPISFITVTESQDSSTQVFITTPNENSTPASSANTVGRDISDIASTMPSTKHGSADEVTVTKMRPSTPAEKDELPSATTEVSDSVPSTSDVLITATMDITQRESTVTPREYISGSTFATSSESTSTPAEQSSTMMEGVNATMVLPSASTGKDELLEVTTEASETTASTTGETETEGAASKAFTSTKGTLSTTTPEKVTSAAITKRTFLENDDPITDASTAFLSTAITTVSPIAESTSTITSKPTVTSSIIPTILPSTETNYSQATSTASTSTTVPSSISTEVPSTTTSARPTTTNPQTCVDAKRIGKSRINCSKYRRMCFIEGYKNMLKKYCPVTCGYCKCQL